MKPPDAGDPTSGHPSFARIATRGSLLKADRWLQRIQGGSSARAFNRPARRVIGAAAAILLLGGLLRLHALGARGFWGDEIWTAQASVSQPASILRYYLSYPGPLYYLLGHVAVAVLGNVSLEFALRLPSVIASLLCLAVFFALAHRYAGPAVALLGMLLLAVAPYQVWYAQEARFYGWSTLLALLATYALLRALDEPRPNRFWVVFGVTSVANLYNQPLPASLALAGQLALAGIWLLFSRPRRLIVGKTFAAYVLIAAAYWPVIQRVLTTGRMDAFNSQSFLAYQVLDFWVTLAGTAREMVDKFAAGGVSGWLFLAFFVAGLVAMARQRQWKLLAITLVPLLTAVLLFAAARPRTGFLVRYVLYVQPLYLLGVAAGILATAAWLGTMLQRLAVRRDGASPTPAGWAGLIAAGLVVLLTTRALLQVSQSYTVAKINDWRAVARYVDAHVQPGDLIVGNRWFKDALSWYLQHKDQVTMSPDNNEDVLEDLAGGRRIWYLQLGPSKGDVSAAMQQHLQTIAPTAWEEIKLDYATDSFFPVSESPVEVRLGEGGPTAVAQFYDEMPAGAGKTSYRILPPGDHVVVQLALPATRGARALEISHYHNPRSTLAVSLDEMDPVVLRGEAGIWLETRVPIPANVGDTVTVRVQSIGEHPARLHALRLVPDDGLAGHTP